MTPTLRNLTGNLALESKQDAAITLLTAIAGSTVGLDALLTAIDGDTSPLAALLTSIHNDLVTIQGYVDGLEGDFATLNAKDFAQQATLATRATEATLALVKGDLDDVKTKLDSVITNTGTAVVDIAALELTADQVNLNTDQIEAKLDTLHADLGTTNADLTTVHNDLVAIEGYVDGVEGKLDTLHADLGTIEGYVDGVEGLLTTLNGKDFAQQATLAAILALIPAALGTGGGMKMSMVTALAGEDFTNSLLAVHAKPHGAAGYSSTLYQSLAAVTKASIKAATGNVYAVRITNDNAAARYFQLHNKASAPAGGDSPQLVVKVPGGTAAAPGSVTLDRSFFSEVENFSLGIAWAISTTLTTFTDAATAAEHLATIRYV